MVIEYFGAEGRLCQDGQLCHEDYFELKAIETLQAQEKLCPSFNYREESKLGLAQNKGY